MAFWAQNLRAGEAQDGRQGEGETNVKGGQTIFHFGSQSLLPVGAIIP